MRKLQIPFILFVGVVAMSSASVLIRWAQAEEVPSLVIASYRLTIATVALSIPFVSQRGWKEYATLTLNSRIVLVVSGGLLGLHFASWITSLEFTSVVSSVVLVTTTPLWVAIAGPIILREKTPSLVWIGIVIAISGGVIISAENWSADSRLNAWGDLLALGGAIFGAGYFLIGRKVREHLPLLPYLWVVYGTAALLVILWSILSGLPLFGYTLVAMVPLLLLGLVPQLIGHSAANYAVRHLSATLVSVTILGEPVGSAILAIIFFNEWPTLVQLAGATMILGGITVTSLADNTVPSEPINETT